MKIRIKKKLNEGSFTDQLNQMIGSDADSITGDETLPPKGPRRRAPPPQMKMKKKYEIILEKKGFNIENIVELGSGMYGSVFKVINPEGDEVAVKVMHEGGIGDMAMNREMDNYRTVQEAREQSELVAKHFPNVFSMFVEDRYGFIVMELLTNKGGRMNLVQDIFQGREGLVAPTGDTIEQGVYKDVRRRMYTYLTNDRSRDKIIDNLLDGADENIIKRVKDELSHLPYLQLPAFEAGKNDELYYKILNRMNDVFLYTARDAFLDGFGELKKEYASNPGLLVFIIKLMEIIREEDMMFYYQNNIGIAMSWSDFLRKGSAIGVHNRPEVARVDRGGADPEVGDAIGEAASIRQAIEELEAITGLAGRDMHEGNIMIREYTGDIVIVDLGLFKPRSEVVEERKKKRKKRRKKRRTPRRAVYWGGYGYHDHSNYGGDFGGDGGGGDGKRDDNKENIMKKTIKVNVLKERCEKGYKTHPTQKTKEMYGKTYRNCIKAEEAQINEEEEEMEEGKICDAGISYVIRTDPGGKDIKRGKDTDGDGKGELKNWSARAAQIASKYCKDPNYGKGRGKDAKNEELSPEAEQELKDIEAELGKASKMHKSQKVRIKKIRQKLDERNKNCGCGQDPCKTYGIQEKKEGGLKAWEKENWTHSDGSPCGDPKGGGDGSDSRCKPASKWKTMSKSEKAADNRKKAAGTKKGKQYVKSNHPVTKSHTKRNENLTEEKQKVVKIKIKQELDEKKKKPCKKAKGKRYVKRVNGRCRSFGQAGQAKGGGDRIRPGTKKGDAYCARSAKIKKCKNPPCANDLSRKKWKCRGSKSMKE